MLFGLLLALCNHLLYPASKRLQVLIQMLDITVQHVSSSLARQACTLFPFFHCLRLTALLLTSLTTGITLRTAQVSSQQERVKSLSSQYGLVAGSFTSPV